MKHPSVAIVILNWNHKQDTLKCLESVFRLKYGSFDVIVVDNGSRDGSLETIVTEYPAVTFVEISRNVGFAAGNNVGIRLALERNHDYILLLNDDSTVREDVLDELLSLAEKDLSIAAVGAKVLCMNDDSKTWTAFGRITYLISLAEVVGMFDESEKYRDIKEVDWVAGCGMLLRASALREVGLLDDDLFAYYEDVEWCIRARKHGYKILFAPDAVIWHKGSSPAASDAYLKNRDAVADPMKRGSYFRKLKCALSLVLNLPQSFSMTPHKTYLNIRNNLKVAGKHGTLLQKLRFFSSFAVVTPFWVYRMLREKDVANAKAHMRAILDFVLRKPNRMWLELGGSSIPQAPSPDEIRIWQPRPSKDLADASRRGQGARIE